MERFKQTTAFNLKKKIFLPVVCQSLPLKGSTNEYTSLLLRAADEEIFFLPLHSNSGLVSRKESVEEEVKRQEKLWPKSKILKMYHHYIAIL